MGVKGCSSGLSGHKLGLTKIAHSATLYTYLVYRRALAKRPSINTSVALLPSRTLQLLTMERLNLEQEPFQPTTVEV